ncbi:DNA-binding transcriptional regulator of sugar metabolism, DeoR/GlpR family [Aneurinibacillus thermoaerophilus]|uniref:DNA-binding transcriptional regulator of sugar metabolism, DeoR/GlpR family n=1 Tax=Aneurinibacillus thermoaerophilus TaxID=143495 RepID=A0A1G7Y0N6_ANETH|nr:MULTISPECIES: DeoR/GlpR family DNA-binding transcription regulator [Aneurinibacillus]AMA72978.1 DeoR family transcriptional regulator [Aneurinibacillus sp. XH2]MED0675925.1 DeoR/GlpR family DNA-binding transcription regulator [Aneurinibacillus thermoaerophilus]SDG89957.1 DNA-binding transcriptional regulator of sugar metabolism, DeoR/GlpR family [Aneurinibacillus thermoaerophilus]
MSLIGEERKQFILHLLHESGKVRTTELVEKLEVSSETIRRYLEELENEKKLKRVYGGAVKVNYGKEEPSIYTREILYAEEKKRIGRAAASLIQDNEIIAIDDGTTTIQLVHYLTGKENLTVITASVPVLSLLLQYENQGLFSGEIFFIGGKVNPRYSRTSGSLAEKMMENFYVDKAFIAIDGISPERGITSYDVERAMLSRKFMEQATQTIVMFDGSKIGVSNFYKLADLEDTDVLISNVSIPVEWEKAVRATGAEWLVAD